MEACYSILYVIWSFAAAVILFNLLIAMMSASFQEVPLSNSQPPFCPFGISPRRPSGLLQRKFDTVVI